MTLKQSQLDKYQQDANIEFFRIISEDIDSELNKSKKISIYQEIIYSKNII